MSELAGISERGNRLWAPLVGSRRTALLIYIISVFGL